MKALGSDADSDRNPDPAPVITIDGPSGSGKGTIARAVARQLGWTWLDSGALYRLVGLAGQRAGLSAHDEQAHARLAQGLSVRFTASPDGEDEVWFEGRNWAGDLRDEAVGRLASQVAAWPLVRAALIDVQRAFKRPPGLVADGRDMGSALFPDANLKIFLTASVEERARRRYKQLKDKGLDVSLADLSRDIQERDQRDSTRAASPLRQSDDALLIDSTSRDVGQIVKQILTVAQCRGLMGPSLVG